MTPIDIAKNVVNFVVGAGTYRISKSIIDHNTDPETTYQKVSNNAASLVIATMAADATTSWTDQKIDEFVLWWKENVKITPAS